MVKKLQLFKLFFKKKDSIYWSDNSFNLMDEDIFLGTHFFQSLMMRTITKGSPPIGYRQRE